MDHIQKNIELVRENLKDYRPIYLSDLVEEIKSIKLFLGWKLPQTDILFMMEFFFKQATQDERELTTDVEWKRSDSDATTRVVTQLLTIVSILDGRYSILDIEKRDVFLYEFYRDWLAKFDLCNNALMTINQ